MNLQPLLEALSEEADFSLQGLDASDWAQLARAIRHGAFTAPVLVRLAERAAGNEAAVPVLAELTADLSVSLAISRALLTEDSVDHLMQLLEESGLLAAWDLSGPPERLMIPLARLLGNSRAWLWLARALFHSSVVAVVPEMVRDRDETVRLAAVSALARTEGDEATEALFGVLHDASNQVRATALEGLQERCADPALKKRLADERLEVRRLVAHAKRHPLNGILSAVPGLSGLLAAVSPSQETSPVAASRRLGVLEGLRRRFRFYRDREDATAYVVLAVAMAWADGSIHEEEAKFLDDLVREYLTDEEHQGVRPLLEQRPGPDELAPYLKRLKNPAEVAAAFSKDLDVHTEEAIRWLREVAAAAGLPEDTLIA